MIDSHKVKRMSQGGKDVTVHHSHSALTVRLVLKRYPEPHG